MQITERRSLTMHAITAIAAIVLATACGADDRRGTDRDARAPESDAGVVMLPDGGAGWDGGVVVTPTDGAMPTGPVEVRCYVHDGPALVITQPWDGDPEGARALARVRMHFDAPARGIAIDEVARVASDGAVAWTWDGAHFAGPEGFDGTVTAPDGIALPTVLFTATDDAQPEDIALCDVSPVQRDAGHLVVRGRTDQSGAFETTCELSNIGLFDSDLRVACARGLPGFLHGIASFGSATEHSIMYAESQVAGYADTTRSITGLAADGLTVRSLVEDDVFMPACAAAQTWEVPGGTHQIWRGRTSDDTYTGPIAPSTEESAFYFWQAPGTIPSGFCFPPDMGPTPPEDECRRPQVQLVVTGTSSAGPWEWESGVFTCYEH
jgi:hypothetical protein